MSWLKKEKGAKKEAPGKKKLEKKGKSESQSLENAPETEKRLNPADDKKLKRKEAKPKVKKERDAVYVMKKNTAMKVLRTVFWIMLTLIFLRGVYQIVRPTKAAELNRIISDFKRELADNGDHPEEVMRYAQDFAKEYLTYSKGGEAEFKERIRPYVSKRVYRISGIYSFRNSAKAVYINAYRKESVGEERYDVFVNAEIEYENRDAETGEVSYVTKSATLKVPVVVGEEGYSIPSLPMLVTDTRADDSYDPQEIYRGAEVDKTAIEPAISNFLAAYYSQDQSMIDYLLTVGADRMKFQGMEKRFELDRVDSVKAYMAEGTIVCAVRATITDSVNQESMAQEFTIYMVENDGKYYVNDMDLQVAN